MHRPLAFHSIASIGQVLEEPPPVNVKDGQPPKLEASSYNNQL